MITYKKLHDGSWGVIGPVSEVKVGQITVTKANKEKKTEIVRAVSKPFGNGLCIGFLASSITKGVHHGHRRGHQDCTCDCEDCARGCRCEKHCICRGGNVCDC